MIHVRIVVIFPDFVHYGVKLHAQLVNFDHSAVIAISSDQAGLGRGLKTVDTV